MTEIKKEVQVKQEKGEIDYLHTGIEVLYSCTMFSRNWPSFFYKGMSDLTVLIIWYPHGSYFLHMPGWPDVKH